MAGAKGIFMTNVNSKKIVFPVISILSVAALLLASGCAKYRGQNLQPLASVDNKKEENVKMSYKVFDQFDCKKYFDRDVIKKGYQPVQITIVNNSNRYIEFAKDRLTLAAAPVQEVADKVHTSTLGRSAGYGTAGAILLWPLVIPAIVDGVKSSNANQRLDRDFDNKDLKTQIISPYHTLNGVIFVPKGKFRPDFEVTLLEINTQKKIVLNNSKMSFNF